MGQNPHEQSAQTETPNILGSLRVNSSTSITSTLSGCLTRVILQYWKDPTFLCNKLWEWHAHANNSLTLFLFALAMATTRRSTMSIQLFSLCKTYALHYVTLQQACFHSDKVIARPSWSIKHYTNQSMPIPIQLWPLSWYAWCHICLLRCWSACGKIQNCLQSLQKASTSQQMDCNCTHVAHVLAESCCRTWRSYLACEDCYHTLFMHVWWLYPQFRTKQ